MNALTPNIPLLRKCLEWVEEQAAKPAHESEWFQGTWRISSSNLASFWQDVRTCGTAYCVAGYACEISGMEWGNIRSGKLAAMVVADENDDPAVEYVSGGKSYISAQSKARSLLGLTEDQASELFAGCNDLRRVQQVAREIAASVGEEL